MVDGPADSLPTTMVRGVEGGVWWAFARRDFVLVRKVRRDIVVVCRGSDLRAFGVEDLEARRDVGWLVP